MIGAGIAGLNALFVAQSYLPEGARVLLVDRGPGPGGMWHGAYDFVRLHQPHPMFTVGDIPWAWRKPRAHLASKPEILTHFEHCLARLRANGPLETCFETTASAREEGAGRVTVTLSPLEGGPARTITAERVIHAAGYDVHPPEALRLSARSVRSLTPNDMEAVLQDATAPVYIIGGGKTGMDAAHAILSQQPGRPVTILSGSGTVFGNRDRMMPQGWRRWLGGRLLVSIRREMALAFDGQNADAVFERYRAAFAISPGGPGARHLFGLMGAAECALIATRAKAIEPEYLEDVEEGAERPEMRFRSGGRRAVPPGAIFLTCTGHMLRDLTEAPPLLSAQGSILAVHQRATISFLSSVSAYFLTHLYFLDRLHDSRVWVLDLPDLAREGGPRRAQMVIMTQSLVNALHLLREVPFGAIRACALDLDRWYPLPRRLWGLFWLKRQAPRLVAHCERSLERVRAQGTALCAPLGEVVRAHAP